MDELWPLNFQDLDAFSSQQVGELTFNGGTLATFLQYPIDTTESFNNQHLSFNPSTSQQWEPESVIGLWGLQDATTPTQWEPRSLMGLEEPQDLSTRNNVGYSDRSELVKGKKGTCIPCWALKRKVWQGLYFSIDWLVAY
jgi:hypothetical protein